MIAIIDYGVGNLFSLHSSLKAIGAKAIVTRKPEEILAARRVILPGVGAFGDAMDKLNELDLAGVVHRVAAAGTPLLGICLGMQLLFEKSGEFGNHGGLGLLSGEIAALQPDLRQAGFDYKVPHMGWNALRFLKPESPLLKYSKEGDSVYYVHSYYAKHCGSSLVADSEYGVGIPGVVQRDNVYGTQFHPEKSGDAGLRILKAFTEVPPC